MIGCLRTPVHKQLIVALYFEFKTVLKFYILETSVPSEDSDQPSHPHEEILKTRLTTDCWPDWIDTRAGQSLL